MIGEIYSGYLDVAIMIWVFSGLFNLFIDTYKYDQSNMAKEKSISRVGLDQYRVRNGFVPGYRPCQSPGVREHIHSCRRISMSTRISVNQNVKFMIVLLLSCSLLTGCWDRMEIEERAVVLGISIDTADKDAEAREDEISHLRGKYPAPKQELIQLSVQIALPGRIPLGPGEGGGSGEGEQETVWVLDVVGHTVDDAMMNLQQQISGKLFFGHLRVIVVSEEFARKGIENLNDYLHRNAEVRRMAWLMISKGKAKNHMQAAPKLERVPALYLASTLDDAVKHGKFPSNYIGTFWSNSSKKGQEGFLPYIKIMKGDNVEISGMAFLKEPKW